jgi:hypothetical protein
MAARIVVLILFLGTMAFTGIAIFITTRRPGGIQSVWRDILERWAAKHNYQLVEMEFENSRVWTYGVYRIVVADQNGQRRQGRVKVIDWSPTDMDKNVEVQWDN